MRRDMPSIQDITTIPRRDTVSLEDNLPILDWGAGVTPIQGSNRGCLGMVVSDGVELVTSSFYDPNC